MTIYRATVLDTPDSPFDGGRLRAEQDCGLAVEGGDVGLVGWGCRGRSGGVGHVSLRSVRCGCVRRGARARAGPR